MRTSLLILGLIILLGFFLRTYQLVERFEFAHDGDLYSWIAKDILVNGHFRLIGQLTSAPGIFIGPLFYYLIALSFFISNMDPIGATIPITIIGLLTIVSYYFVFSRLFNIKIGLIAAFLYTILVPNIIFDRQVFPSTLTNLWTIWYFFTVIMITRGKFNVLPILGILIGLIWHIHIALLPTLSAIPVAFLISKKLPTFSQVIKLILAAIITSLPFIIFELKHNFQQFFGILHNFTTEREEARGLYKFQLVLEMISKNINNLFFSPQSFKITQNIFFPPIILLSALILIKKKLISVKELVPLLVWIFSVVLLFSISSSPISEYYFYNIEIIFLTIITLLLYFLFKLSKWTKYLVVGLLILVAAKNAHFIITQDIYHKGYVERKAAVDYIVTDAKMRNFPCFSINYITAPGENVGFRYFLYLKGAHIAVAGGGSPVYNIVIPDEYSKEVKVKFGHIGIIPPVEIPSTQVIEKACSGENTNLTDPMFGYVE